MIDFQNVSVFVNETPFCPSSQGQELYKAWFCDLTSGTVPANGVAGEVLIPFFWKTPTYSAQGFSDCVLWGYVKMTRDTAVYLAKESLWSMVVAQYGQQAAAWVPADAYSGNWDCVTAQYAVLAYQAMMQQGPNAKALPLDGLLMAYLLTNSLRFQQLLADASKAVPAAVNALQGQVAGAAAVPPPVQTQGALFVPQPVPAGCDTGTGGGTTVQPGQPGMPGTGYTPVGADTSAAPWYKSTLFLTVAGVATTVAVTAAGVYAGVKLARPKAGALGESFEEEERYGRRGARASFMEEGHRRAGRGRDAHGRFLGGHRQLRECSEC